MSEEREQQTAYQPRPSLKDRLGLTKENLIHIAMAVIIAVIISAVVASQTGVSGGTYAADMVRMEQGITTMGSNIADNAQDISDLRGDIRTTTEQYSGVANTVALHTGSIDSLGGRIDTVEGNITAIEDELATASDSPPEGYLTGMVGNYTLHARCSEAGNFTANVHLVFATPTTVGNATTYSEAVANFTATVNYTVANVKPYVPVAIYNGTAWGISQVWWNIGTFALAADTEATISILFGGLANTSSFAYVEVWPILK